MSVDTQPVSEPTPLLRREALLPNERNRGLGTVAVVCTMAGVASGLALATTLMAMQVADSMAVRTCPYRITMPAMPQEGFLGVANEYKDGYILVKEVKSGTPAAAVNLQPGDHILELGGAPLHSRGEFMARIAGTHPGTPTQLIVQRGNQVLSLEPTLVARPANQF
jgi:S1-C subfamily serine protease